ncbi:MAG: carotenoid oxygenase family protein [Dermatophilaceae bacterium]
MTTAPHEATLTRRRHSSVDGDFTPLTTEVVHDATSDRAELVVLDAADVAAAPVAWVHLPQRVPFGFYGNWIDAAELDDDVLAATTTTDAAVAERNAPSTGGRR